jgi:hypothetical protein
MTLAQLRQLSRGLIPGAKIQVIDNATMDLVLNEGVKDIATYTLCLKTNKKFTVTDGKFEYDLSTLIGDYLTPDKSGLWWNNGSVWRQLNPVTLKYLDEFKTNWRSLGEASPMDYSIDGDILTLSPTPNTTLANGLWLYYAERPISMTEDSHYPFSGSATELTHLSIFDFAIILFAKMRLEPMLNKTADANLSMQEYIREREEKMNLLYRRKDVISSSDTRLQGPAIR